MLRVDGEVSRDCARDGLAADAHRLRVQRRDPDELSVRRARAVTTSGGPNGFRSKYFS